MKKIRINLIGKKRNIMTNIRLDFGSKVSIFGRITPIEIELV